MAVYHTGSYTDDLCTQQGGKKKSICRVTLLALYTLCMPCQESVEGAESETTVCFFLVKQGLGSFSWRSFALPRHASCTHSNTGELKPDWRGQADPLLPAECSGFGICDGVLAGTRVCWASTGSRSQYGSLAAHLMTGRVQPDKAVLMWPAIITHSSQSAASTLGIYLHQAGENHSSAKHGSLQLRGVMDGQAGGTAGWTNSLCSHAPSPQRTCVKSDAWHHSFEA